MRRISFNSSAVVLNFLLKGGAVDELHDDERRTVAFVDGINSDNVSVANRSRCSCLPQESFHGHRVSGQGGSQQLNGYRSVQFGIVCSQNHTHASTPHEFDDLIRSECSQASRNVARTKQVAPSVIWVFTIG